MPTNRHFYRRCKRLFLLGLCGTALAIILVGTADYRVDRASNDRVFTDPHSVPPKRVGLVLGTAPKLLDGRDNLYFTFRIDAAARLFHAGAVEFLLLSGDNGTRGYDEPTDMFHALRARDIPADRMLLDYAGFRTLDSVVRAREVFQVEDCVVISQPFHVRRALFLAEANGIDAVGFTAHDVGGRAGTRMWIRERLARAKALVDVWTGKRPRFLGDPVPVCSENAGPELADNKKICGPP